MSREIRRVAPGWEHPKDESGNYIPMHEHFSYTEEEVAEGLRDGWLTGEPPYYDVPVMPQWTPEEATAYQVYEDVSEGTPVTPVLESPEAIIEYLSTRGTFYGGPWRRAAAEQFVKDGWAISMVVVGGRVLMGAEDADIIKSELG